MDISQLLKYIRRIMDLNIHLKSVINHRTCPRHKQKATLVIKGKDLELECCCNDFKLECLNKIAEVLNDFQRALSSIVKITGELPGRDETKGSMPSQPEPDPNTPYFFSVNHITMPFPTKLIYGIKFKGLIYYLYKSLGIEDCEQLDNHQKLEAGIFKRMCDVITAIEIEYKRIPPIQYINLDIFNILVRADNPGFFEGEQN